MRKKIGIGVLSILMVTGLVVFAGSAISSEKCCPPSPGCCDGAATVMAGADKAGVTEDAACDFSMCCAK